MNNTHITYLVYSDVPPPHLFSTAVAHQRILSLIADSLDSRDSLLSGLGVVDIDQKDSLPRPVARCLLPTSRACSLLWFNQLIHTLYLDAGRERGERLDSSLEVQL